MRRLLSKKNFTAVVGSVALTGATIVAILMSWPHTTMAAALAPESLPSAIAVSDTTTTATPPAEVDTTKLFPQIKIQTAEARSTTGTVAMNTPLRSLGGVYTAVAETISVLEPVNSDLFTAGKTIHITSPIDGDLFAAANTIVVDANITGSLRLAANNVVITNSTISKNVLIFAKGVNIANSVTIAGNLNVYASEVTVDGQVQKKTHLESELASLNGTFTGLVTTETDHLTIGPKALFTEAPKLSVANSTNIAPEAQKTTNFNIAQTIRHGQAADRDTIAEKLTSGLISYFVFAVLGVLFLLLWPYRSQEIVTTINQNPARTFKRGLLFFILVPLAAILLIFTLIGIPLSVMLIVAYTLLMLVARVFSGYAIGQHLIDHHGLHQPSRAKWRPYVQLVCGYFILAIIFTLPKIGWLISLIASIWGIGGILSTCRCCRIKKVNQNVTGQSPTTPKPVKFTPRLAKNAKTASRRKAVNVKK